MLGWSQLRGGGMWCWEVVAVVGGGEGKKVFRWNSL